MWLLAGCARADADRPAALAAQVALDTARPWRKPGDKIDSLLPMAEYLRRFRAGLPQPVRLAGGEVSREALARRFLAAIAAQDSAALIELALTRAEFAWLVFSDHRYVDPPYELDPEIFWMQLTAESAKGITRALRRYQSHSLTFLALQCQRDTLQIRRGPAKLWGPCALRYRDGAREETRRLFGSLVERDGRVKLLSFANDF
ncbi:MAG TPA: hypothetical protein VGQ69_09255 [Gemmatimonadales bacterium]|nr:hypothetical protein [Gemmatimonadales bacterium]